MRADFAAAVCLAAACGAAGAAAQGGGRVPVWSAWAENGHGGADDCTDCLEDEYVAMSCARGGGEVRVELIGLLPPEDAGDRVAVTLEVDGEGQARQAAVEWSEMFGPVPVLILHPGDALFARLREGAVLTLSMEGDQLDVPLTGAAEALDVMFAACR